MNAISNAASASVAASAAQQQAGAVSASSGTAQSAAPQEPADDMSAEAKMMASESEARETGVGSGIDITG